MPLLFSLSRCCGQECPHYVCNGSVRFSCALRSEKAKTILLSVNKDDRELFIDIGGQRMKVVRNELCPEEYFAVFVWGSLSLWSLSKFVVATEAEDWRRGTTWRSVDAPAVCLHRYCGVCEIRMVVQNATANIRCVTNHITIRAR